MDAECFRQSQSGWLVQAWQDGSSYWTFAPNPLPPESDLQEVLNYVEALHDGLQRLNTLPISQRLFRELHERLMRGVRIVFRSVS